MFVNYEQHKKKSISYQAILAVTLVVGGMLAAISSSTTQSASAYPQKKVAHDKGKHNGRGNDNTDTNQICNNNAYASGLALIQTTTQLVQRKELHPLGE